MTDEFQQETERIQKIVDELCRMGHNYEVLDFIEALGATLGTYLVANGGMPLLKHYLKHLLKTGKRYDRASVRTVQR